MANVSWKNNSAGNWNTAANWSNNLLPTSADTVTIGFGSSSNTFAVAENTPNANASTLKIDGDTSGGSNPVTLSLVGNTLTVASTVLLNNDQSRISGFGTLSAGGAISTGAGGTGSITAIGGVLNLTGVGSLSGVALSIDTGSTDSTLKIGLAGGATSAAIGLSDVDQWLEVGPGNLTLTSKQNVTAGAHIKMSGGTLTDSSGIDFNASPLSGFGTVAANLTRSAGTPTITASGGTLNLTGTVGSGFAASIDGASASTLKFGNTGTLATAITINDADQTLEVGGVGAALTIGAAQNVTLGTIKLGGGSLTDTAGIGIGTGATLTGFGTVNTGTTAATDFDGTGTVTATGGVLAFTKATNDASATAYHIADVSGSVLRFDGAVGDSNTFPTVTFDNAGGPSSLGTLNLTDTTNLNFKGIVNNFISGDTIVVKNATSASLDGTGTILTVKNGGTTLEAITLGKSYTGANFFVNAGAITTDLVCYGAGTRILTTTGEKPVESLTESDIVLTLSGEELIAQPIKWIGRRHIDITAHPRPETVAPVRIRRGAFAEAMPHTDLLVSPDHAIFVDDKLICARQLINGTTIQQEKGWTSVEYFHVELDAHAVLLAEGLPAESYLNTGNSGFFVNSDQPLVLHPDLTAETDYPSREAGSCAPFVWDEASVRPVWQRLAERAEALGQPVPQLETTADPELRVVAKGRTLQPLHRENGLYVFALPHGATEVSLVSRAGALTDTRPWLEDRRCFGVYVDRISLRSATEMHQVPLDHPGLSQGWWAVDQKGSALRRWTDGHAVLPLPSLDGPALLEIRASRGAMAYVTAADHSRLAA